MYSMKTICDAMKSFINLKEKDNKSALDYLKCFKASRDVFLSPVGKDIHFPKMLEEHPEHEAARVQYLKMIQVSRYEEYE